MKLYTGIFIALLMTASQMGFAAQIVRQASARVAIYKTTMSLVNGKYTRTENKICENVLQFPVTDERLGGTLPGSSVVSDRCASTVQNKPVEIVTTPLTWLSETEAIPWKPGQKVELKGLGVISYVYALDRANPPTKLQETLRANSFTEDLGLKDMGFILSPFIEFKEEAACTIEKDAKASQGDCERKQSVNLEEYFSAYVYIEDKNN